MTVAATTRRAGPFAGNGVTTAFPFTFKVFKKDDVAVVLTDPNGSATTLVLDSDYSVSLSLDQDSTPGGVVTYPIVGSPMATGYTLAMIGDLEYQQPTDITNTGRFLPQVIENALDRVTILTQQLKEIADRSLQAAIGTTVKLIFPAPSSGKFIRWRTDLTGLENAEAGTDSMALQGLLADNTVGTRGAGMVGFDASKTFPAGTIGNYVKALPNVSVPSGAGLVGYTMSVAGPAIPRTVQSKLDDVVNAADFGLKTTNTATQNVTALQHAVDFALAIGGCTIHINRGTYDFNATIEFGGCHNTRITGEGTDATILRITHPTVDFFKATTPTWYTSFDNFTLTSTVTRTAGAMIGHAGMYRGLINRLKIMRHFDGIRLSFFEVCTISECAIVTPTGAGISIIAGAPSAIQTGANLSIVDCFLRGNDDANGAATPVGSSGLVSYDCQAIFGVNTDIGAYRDQCWACVPTTATYNHHFVQCYFDGTLNGDNILLAGAGQKARFQFTGCWFNGAGQMTGGGADCFGVNFTNNGTYSDFNFSGCRFVSQKASAIAVSTPWADINLSGCVFNNVADTTATYRYAIYVNPASAQSAAMNISGCKFIASGNALFDMRFETNCRNNMLTGNMLQKGVSVALGATFLKCASNGDATTDSIASADPLIVSPTKDFYNITGGTTVGTIPQTYPGHRLTLVASSGLTFNDSASLHLAGNYVAPASGVLNLVCEPAGGGWREVSRVNT